MIDDHLDLDHLRAQLEKNNVVVAEIRPLAPTLEDVFVELTYKHQAKQKRRRRVVNPFRGFGAVVYKEALHVRRDFGTLFFSLIIPLLQMFLLGFGIDTNVRQINTVVYNADGRRESRELLDRLQEFRYIPRNSLCLLGSRPERRHHLRKMPRGHQDSRRLLR